MRAAFGVLGSCAVVAAIAGLARGAERLEVGPGKRFAVPSAALGAARDGDTIEIDAAGNYDGDVAYVRANGLTIRGVGAGRARLDSKGKTAGGKAILVTTGRDTTIENVEFVGARCPDRNGAGIRPEGKDLTLRNCKFHDCENGILGGAGTLVIEHCEFSHCGPVAEPATHNLYLGQGVEKLVFRFNYSHHVIRGHLLKSRARENHILYNRLSDEADGTGSYVINLPNGGRGVIVGNVLHKGPKADNQVIIAYGEEGVKYPDSELYVVHNTMIHDRHRGSFIRVQKVPDDFRIVVRNNIFAGKHEPCNWPKAVMEGNFTGGDPLFVDRATWDLRLRAGSPCIDAGVTPGKAGDVSLVPEFHYVHPAGKEARPKAGKIDVGAYEFAAQRKGR